MKVPEISIQEITQRLQRIGNYLRTIESGKYGGEVVAITDQYLGLSPLDDKGKRQFFNRENSVEMMINNRLASIYDGFVSSGVIESQWYGVPRYKKMSFVICENVSFIDFILYLIEVKNLVKSEEIPILALDQYVSRLSELFIVTHFKIEN